MEVSWQINGKVADKRVVMNRLFGGWGDYFDGGFNHNFTGP